METQKEQLFIDPSLISVSMEEDTLLAVDEGTEIGKNTVRKKKEWFERKRQTLFHRRLFVYL